MVTLWHACRHVQRVIPVEGMCEPKEDVLQSAVAKLAAEHVAGMPAASIGMVAGSAAAADEEQAGEADTRTEELQPLRYAVAWRSRHADSSPAECTLPVSAAGTSPGKEGTAAPADAGGRAADQSRHAENAAEDAARLDSKIAPVGVQDNALTLSNGSIGRDEAITAAAAGFVQGTAGVRRATVDLRKPDVVVMVEGVPVGRRMLCALSIVSAELVTQNTKLNILPVGGS